MKREGYNPKKVGEKSEGQILALMLRMGKVVLMPFGDNQRYDFVTEEAGKFTRIQCKTGRLKDGAIEFDTCSSSYHRKGGKKRSYEGEADVFGVYCPASKKCYLILVKDVPKTCGKLRIDPPKNNQVKCIRWAKDYEIDFLD